MGAPSAGALDRAGAGTSAHAAMAAAPTGLPVGATPTPRSLPAVKRGPTFYLGPQGGGSSFNFNYGIPGDVPLMCDWTGDGTAGVGVFRNGVWYIRKNLGSGPADFAFSFGIPGDIPVCGDWTGQGHAMPGVFRNGFWYLRTSLTSGPGDIVVAFGIPGDRPVVGRWNGGRIDTPGVFRGGVWYLRSTISSGPADIAPFYFGIPTDIPVVGDWTGSGSDRPGVFRNGTWYLRNSITSGPGDQFFVFGGPGDQPVTWFSGSYLWGIDTTDNVKTTNDLAQTKVQLGTPAFVGRYLVWDGGSTLGSDEAQYIHGQGVRILAIIDPAPPAGGLTGAAVAQAEASRGINQARLLGVPAGAALFRDVENTTQIDAAYIAGWAAAFAGSGYVPGIYENPSNSSFPSSYCSAVSSSPLAASIALWSDEPQVNADPRQTGVPAWNPYRPACQNSTVAWQYLIRSLFPAGVAAPNVDVDEFAASAAFSLLW
ncbi:MAG TPA: glycoside hydrolase domain-containing protein [Acidimicrobiales bacterium]|nr:glycoside hydrolase domain-containing protein [Acidimicrobiales bacterium]